MTRIKIRSIKPPALPTRPQCSALLSEQTRAFWHGRRRPGNPDGSDTCGNKASYIIAGKPYCTKHGSLVVLRLAVDAGGIERVS